MATHNLKALQTAFARDIRSGGQEPFTQDPRMKVYRELFFNNVRGFVEGSFPVCKTLLDEDRWQALCRRFFETYSCTTPLFLEISQEFLAFINQLEGEFEDLPYLPELAHYEWLELAVDVMEAEAPQEFDADADLAEGIPVFAPASASSYYQYPVHTASKDHKELENSPVGLIVYRDDQDKVRFVQCNPFTLALYERLRQQPLSVLDAIKSLFQESGIEASEAAIAGGLAIVKEWQDAGLVLGIAR